MKKLFLTSMAFLAMMSAMTLTSCSDDDNGGGDGPGPTDSAVLGGDVEGTLTLDANTEYHLTSALIVREGATLEIPAGTTIKAAKGFGNYILVERGGKINATGTAAKPIIMTADATDATSGHWGGLIINGYAPISGPGGTVSEGATEINTNTFYGGDKADDNSGTIEYVQLLYTGARSSSDIEHNGLTLNAVGSGTTIDNIYIAEGADDAIEFFGGTVNVSNVLAVNCDDDCFDFTQGYSGTLSNCYGIWEDGFVSTESDPRGVEADGNLDGEGSDHTPQANFTIEDMTIVNNASAQAMQDAIKVRRDATAHITNAVVYGAGEIQNLVDLTDSKDNATTATEISVTNNAYYVSEDVVNNGGTAYSGVQVQAGNTGADTSAFGWTGYQFPTLSPVTTVTGNEIPLEITEPMALEAGKEYSLNGSVHVKDGGVLIIPAGMTVKANEGFDNFILVERGGKIYAAGTEDAPITFTADADNASAGYWGGLIINGYAHISGTEGTVAEGTTEIDANIPYGGDNDADYSGVLTYVRILYSGARSSSDIEHNGLTLNAVGSNTKISNIYIAEGADDAIEFFGGSVSVDNLLAVNCDDDCFDFTQGYNGTLSNCYGRWEAGFTSTEDDPRGVEADGNLDGKSPDHTPQSDFTIENMTIENLSTTQAMQDAIKVRRGAKATISNALVIGSGVITELVDLSDGKGTGDAASVINVIKGATNVGSDTNSGNPAGATISITNGNTGGCPTDIFGWTGYTL